MRFLSRLLFLCIASLGLNLPAHAAVTVSSPGNGSTVTSPFTLSATASACGSQTIATMGYSLDNSSSTTVVSGAVLQASVTAAIGTHALHVKSWGKAGASCVTDVAITVAAAASSAVPANALSNTNLETLSSWTQIHDTGTPGTSTGWMGMSTSPAYNGSSRHFATTYTYYGGHRYTVSFGNDTTAQNFLYDAWLYISGSNTGIANIEMDLNQVMANGQTVIFGFQCDGWSGTWDYTANTGTPTSPNDQWIKSSAPCNPRSWGLNQWHHVQIAYSRTTAGVVTYKYVTQDGKQQNINATVSSAFALGWKPALITNFQVDGATSGSGSSDIFLDSLTISRW